VKEMRNILNINRINKLKLFLINEKLKKCILGFMILVIILSSLGLYFNEKNKYTNQKYNTFTYKSNANVRYSVLLVPNKIYSNRTVKEGGAYITNLVDYVKTVFKYQLNGDSKGKVSGKYNVKALLEGYIQTEKGSTTIWKKEYILQQDRTFNGYSKDISLNNVIPIKLKTYKDFASMVYKEIKFNFNTKLTIVWDISIAMKTDFGRINDSLSPVMEIPIEDQYFKITGRLNENNSGNLEAERKILNPFYNQKKNTLLFMIGLCVLLAGFIIVFTATKAKSSPLAKKVQDIFKNHGDRLVVINKSESFTNKDIIEVFSIEDIVRIADDIGRPIFYNKSNVLEEIYNFYLFDEKHVYMVDIRNYLQKIHADKNKGNIEDPISA
jgi:hypothetical protein